MSTIYRKTEQGRNEIATRALRLVPRLRQALILVDGKRSDDELRKLIAPPAEDALQALLEQGHIEVISVTAVHVVLPAEAAPAAPPPVNAVVLTLPETRQRAVRWMSAHLGPYADSTNIRVEKAKTPEAMQAALTLAVTVVRQQLGEAKAAEFEQHVGLAPTGG
jgi:hypothetical protein